MGCGLPLGKLAKKRSMNSQTQVIVDRLVDNIASDDFITTSYALCEELEEADPTGQSIEPLLRLIENHPHADLGAPGPIVHFVEEFYGRGYESLLVESVRRCPVPHTLWMLNRIINGVAEPVKAEFVKELQAVAERDDIAKDVKDSAIRFLELHA